MKQKELATPKGTIVFWVSTTLRSDHSWLVLLPGLTADHRLFEYIELSAHGCCAFSDAVAADRPYVIDCQLLLMCGMEDYAGSAKRYNCEWEKRSGCKVHWIEGAGHNSNRDAPDAVNALIEYFIEDTSAARVVRSESASTDASTPAKRLNVDFSEKPMLGIRRRDCREQNPCYR